MRFTQLEAYCRVVELGSFSAAAEALVVTQPAVSLHVRSLEKELGVRLLERRGRTVLPTPAGRALYRHARAILRLRDRIEHQLKGEGPQPARAGGRPVRLGASATGVSYYLPPLLHAFAAAHPAAPVTTRVDVTDRILQGLVDGELDLGLVWGPVRRAEFDEERLGFDRFCLICHPGHPLARRGRADAADLHTQPFVLGMPGSLTRRFIEARLARVGVLPRAAVEVLSTADMKRAVENGLGLAVVSRKAVEEELEAGRVVELHVPGLRLWREVCLVQPRGRPRSRAATRLARFLRARLELPARPGAPEAGTEAEPHPPGREDAVPEA
jgi:DNA-binding transcriptional LysR family regulator